MRTAALAVSLWLMAAVLPPGGAWADDGWQGGYARPEAYGTAEDEITPAEAGQLLLDLVNAERAAQGAPALILDATATELAITRAAEVAAARQASHYDEAGRKVEQRFNELGRTDHATENLVLYEIRSKVCLTPQLVRRMTEHWLAEPTHRANMLDPVHTAMGAGFSVEYFADEGITVVAAANIFVCDYGDCDRLPPAVDPGSRLWLTGYLAPGAASFAGIALARENREETADPADPMHYGMPLPAIVYVPPGADYPTKGGRPYLISAVDYNPKTGYFSVELYFPRHWQDCRIYVSVMAETGGGRRFPAMTQVLETRPAGGSS